MARLGGDEYAVVAEGLPAPDALALAERVREALRPPIGDLTVDRVGRHRAQQLVGLDAEALLNQADVDMYRAKSRRRRSARRRSARDAAEDQTPDPD